MRDGGLRGRVVTIFLDESGDLGFGKRGSGWFVVGGVVTDNVRAAAESYLLGRIGGAGSGVCMSEIAQKLDFWRKYGVMAGVIKIAGHIMQK